MVALLERLPARARLALSVLGGVAAVVVLMLWLSGAFTRKVQPGPAATPARAPADLARAPVEVVQVPVWREAVGSIAAEHETTVAAQLLGRVVEVHAAAGAHVASGALLVRLDAAEHRARLDQAEAALRQAQDHHGRTERQRRAGTASESALVQATNDLEAARARAAEARTVLDYTELRAPVDGTVIDRACEVGDTVTPGRPLVRLYDRLQLVAVVPESLRSRLAPGQVVTVHVDALGERGCEGTVRELVPEADALSRSFRVKVTGPCPPGLIPGMFGRLRIPLGEREELRVPASAVRYVGQLPLVLRVLPDGTLLRQFVRTGAAAGDRVVVVSGLAPGDVVVTDAARAGAAP